MIHTVAKVKFQDQTLPIKDKITEINKIIETLENTPSKEGSVEGYYLTIAIITRLLTTIEYNLQISSIHFNTFRRHSESHLDSARKALGVMISKANEMFGIRIHISLGDTQKLLDQLVELTPNRVYNLVYKIHTETLKLKSCYLTTSPMNGTVGRMYKDLSGFALNITNFKTWGTLARESMKYQYYQDTMKLFQLDMTMVSISAEFSMEIYQFSKTKEAVQEAISILEQLESMQRLFNDPNIKETARKKESWARFL